MAKKTVAVKGKPKYGVRAAGQPKPQAGKPAPTTPPKPGVPAPVAPTAVPGFLTADDLAQINDFMSNWQTQFANIDAGLNGLQADTTFQTKQNDKQAQEQTAAGTDAMIARGLFRSSIKDAALYDIEATRALNDKFLNDKLTAATLNAGTQKKILADSKKRFDEALLAKQGENAAGVNDAANASWADQMAAWQAAQPKPPAPTKPAAAPGTPHPGGLSFGNQHPGLSMPAAQTGPNTASGSGTTATGATAAKSKPQFGAGAGGKYFWPDGKMHSRPYRGR